MEIININKMPQSKSEVLEYASNVKEVILSGYINGIEAAIMLKSLEEIIKALRADLSIRDMIITEVEKYGKTASFNGNIVSISERRTYDFKDDSEWFILDTHIQEMKEKQKERETFLKAINKPIVDAETGEVINPIPCISTTVTTVNLKK